MLPAAAKFIPPFPQSQPGLPPTPQMNLSQLMESLILDTGSVPNDGDIQAFSKLPLDLERLKKISEFLTETDEIFPLLRFTGIEMTLSDSDGCQNLTGLWIKSEYSSSDSCGLYLFYQDLQSRRPASPEMLMSASQLMRFRIQKDRKCLAGKNLSNMPLAHLRMHNGSLRKTNLCGTNLSNSTLRYVNLASANLEWTILENAVLYMVRLDGARINASTNFTNTKITLYLPKQWTPAKLYRLLATINEFNDVHKDLKINLVHQIIDSLKIAGNKSFAGVQGVFSTLITLLKNPIYLQDKKLPRLLQISFLTWTQVFLPRKNFCLC